MTSDEKRDEEDDRQAAYIAWKVGGRRGSFEQFWRTRQMGLNEVAP